jgi:hypothetical protein
MLTRRLLQRGWPSGCPSKKTVGVGRPLDEGKKHVLLLGVELAVGLDDHGRAVVGYGYGSRATLRDPAHEPFAQAGRHGYGHCGRANEILDLAVIDVSEGVGCAGVGLDDRRWSRGVKGGDFGLARRGIPFEVLVAADG